MNSYSTAAIDKLINQQREQSFQEHSLEHAGVSGEAGTDILDSLYHDIAREAAGLRDDGKYDYRPTVRYRLKDLKWKAAAMAREADRKLQRLSLYKKFIRKLLKIIYYRMLAGPKVNAVLLMRHPDQRYVKELYYKVLGRAPDKEGFRCNLKLLKEHKVSRLDLLDTFCSSAECRNPGRITGRRMAGIIYGRQNIIMRQQEKRKKQRNNRSDKNSKNNESNKNNKTIKTIETDSLRHIDRKVVFCGDTDHAPDSRQS